jgi:hypothetical protein
MKKNVIYLNKNCKICADHFEEHMFRNNAKKRLNEDAVPTLFTIPNSSKTVGAKRRLISRDKSIHGKSFIN